MPVFKEELSGKKEKKKARIGASADFCGVNAPTTASSGHYHKVTGLGRQARTPRVGFDCLL